MDINNANIDASGQHQPAERRGFDPPNASPEAPPLVDSFPAQVRLPPVDTYHQTRQKAAWKGNGHPPRPQSPALPWHKAYSQLNPKQGRVLVIDFVRAEQSQNSKRKVVAQELDSIEGLRKLYKDPRRGADANLRLLHVQNAPWATRFLLRKFNIDGRDELVGSNFGRYARFTKPERRGGKPFPTAKAWRVQHDPWRGISKTSFGFEYLQEYEGVPNGGGGGGGGAEESMVDEKMMELNGYDEDENPAFSYNVYIQRLACYVQHKEDSPSPPFDSANGISNPYKTEPNGQLPRRTKEYLPQLSSLDNENAIILFDNSVSGSFEDCLIAARSEWETHWRRLPFYLAYEAREIVGNDDLLGRQCARMIMDDVFRALVARWDKLLDHSQTHVSILEDTLYEQPADETRAPDLWRNSSLWLQLAKLASAHLAVVRDMRVRFRELVSDITAASAANQTDASAVMMLNDDDWLEEAPGDIDRVCRSIEEDLIKPTQALISLLYQSVSIRDSRLSLQLDTSMWRLSWVTFIFLPLTFMVGFFGMNVDVFASNPSIKWYFIVAVPFMLSVLLGWYIIKHILARQRQTPYQRGIYEAFFHDLSTSYPTLWSRTGPRQSIVPQTRLDRLKWQLIQYWSRPEVTVKAGQANASSAGTDDLSTWSKMKRYLIRHWTNDLITFSSSSDVELASLLPSSSDLEPEPTSFLASTLLNATEMLTVPGQPAASHAIERLDHSQSQPQSPTTDPIPTLSSFLDHLPSPSSISNSIPIPRPRLFSAPSIRPSISVSPSQRTSVLVEEEDPHWICALGQQGKGWYWRPRSTSPKPHARMHARAHSASNARSISGGRSPGLGIGIGTGTPDHGKDREGKRRLRYSAGEAERLAAAAAGDEDGNGNGERGFPWEERARYSTGGGSTDADREESSSPSQQQQQQQRRIPSPLGVVVTAPVSAPGSLWERRGMDDREADGQEKERGRGSENEGDI